MHANRRVWTSPPSPLPPTHTPHTHIPSFYITVGACFTLLASAAAMAAPTVELLQRRLGLQPHPEGGFYAETCVSKTVRAGQLHCIACARVFARVCTGCCVLVPLRFNGSCEAKPACGVMSAIDVGVSMGCACIEIGC